MATVGPTGLTYMVCEMYFDDCTVFVQSSSLLLVPELGPRNSIPRDGEIQKILSVRGTSTNVPSTSSYASQQPPPPPGHPPISTGYSSKPYSGNNQSRRGRGKVLSNLIYHLTSFCYLTFSAWSTGDNRRRWSRSLLAGDFIAKKVVSKLKLEHHVITNKSRTACSGLDSKCYDINTCHWEISSQCKLVQCN